MGEWLGLLLRGRLVTRVADRRWRSFYRGRVFICAVRVDFRVGFTDVCGKRDTERWLSRGGGFLSLFRGAQISARIIIRGFVGEGDYARYYSGLAIAGR